MIRFPEELKKQIHAYAKNHTDAETVAKFGVSKSTVTRYKMGVSRAGKTPHKKTPTTRKHAHPRAGDGAAPIGDQQNMHLTPPGLSGWHGRKQRPWLPC